MQKTEEEKQAEKDAKAAAKQAEKDAKAASGEDGEDDPAVAFSIDGHGVKCDAVEVGSVSARQLEHYAKQDKVRTRIPRGAGEKPGAFETVIVNGLRINILKGESVSLPEDVAKIIEDSYYATDKALNDTRIAPAFGSGPSRPARVDMQSDSDKAAING